MSKHAQHASADDRYVDDRYGESNYVFHRGKVTPVQIDGWGTGFRVDLWTHSEDGRQPEFSGEFLEREEADLVLSAWLTTQGRALLYLGARLKHVQDYDEAAHRKASL